MRTWDLVGRLLDCSARSYLELRTDTTSPEHTEKVVGLDFDRAQYLMYRTPNFEPHGPMGHLPTIDGLDGLAPDERFDIVFVDPWHTMDHSRLVLRWGFDHVAPGGWLVVHDCWPTALELLGEHHGGLWCGDTWRAFQELARAQGNPWCVIDDDYGMGVIGPVAVPGLQRVVVNTMSNPASQWQWITDHGDDPWLVEPDEWNPDAGWSPRR